MYPFRKKTSHEQVGSKTGTQRVFGFDPEISSKLALKWNESTTCRRRWSFQNQKPCLMCRGRGQWDKDNRLDLDAERQVLLSYHHDIMEVFKISSGKHWELLDRLPFLLLLPFISPMSMSHYLYPTLHCLRPRSWPTFILTFAFNWPSIWTLEVFFTLSKGPLSFRCVCCEHRVGFGKRFRGPWVRKSSWRWSRFQNEESRRYTAKESEEDAEAESLCTQR